MKTVFSLRQTAGIIFLFCFISMFFAINTGFIWDDHVMIVQNPAIKTLSLENIKTIFTTDVFAQGKSAYYRPLQVLSYMADFALFGLNPSGWHTVNFLLHFFNSFLLFILAIRLGLTRQTALLSAIFFSVNPIIVEQILVVAGRGELMAAMFSFLALIFFIDAKKSSIWISLLFFTLGIFSKESALGVLPALFIVDYYLYLNKKKLIPLFLLPTLAIFAAREIALASQLPILGGFDILYGSLIKLPLAIFYYLRKTFIPYDLHSYAMIPEFNMPAYFLFFFGLFYFYGIVKKRANPIAMFAVLWYLSFMLPKVPALFGGNFMLDHWAYISNAGLFIFLGFFLSQKSETQTKTSFFAIISILSMWIMLANLNIDARNSDIKIYENAAKYKTSAKVYYNLAREYYMRGDFIKAEKNLSKAVKSPDSEDSFLETYAIVFLNRYGDENSSVKKALTSLKNKKNSAYFYLAVCDYYLSAGNTQKVIETADLAIKLYPENQNFNLKKANAFLINKDFKTAITTLEEILKKNPNNTEALINLGIAEYKRTNMKKSSFYFKKVLETEINNKTALEYLSKIK